MKIAINGWTASLVKDDTLIQKSDRAYTVVFEFDSGWDEYDKTAVFEAGWVTETVSLTEDFCIIPPSCLEVGGIFLKIGVFGTKDNVDTDTIWCQSSRILYRTEIEDIPPPASDAIRSGELVDNTAKFYTTPDRSGDPAFTLVFPEEMHVDQDETTFVADFAWSTEAYPGSTDPNLDGKPVFVLAIVGDDPTVAPFYSFINMQPSGTFVAGNILVADANGCSEDSGVSPNDFLLGTAATEAELSAMLDEVFGSGGI